MTSLRALTYHRVATLSEDSDLNPRLISAEPSSFEAQLRWLRRRHAVVSLADVLAAVDRRKGLPRRAVLITFDDAYADLADHAIPILRTLGLPATVFVPTAFPNHPERSFHADRLHRAFTRSARTDLPMIKGVELPIGSPDERRASLRKTQHLVKSLPHDEADALVEHLCTELGVPPYDRKSVLSWDELRELARNGFTIAAHSRSHAMLTRLPLPEVRREASAAYEDLVRELGVVLPVFCYPNGSHDDGVVAAVREAGYRLAFTTRDGENDVAVDDPMRLRRTNITRKTSGPIFRLRLTRWGARFDRWRHGRAG